MKKTLTLLLTLAMLFTLAACGSPAAPSKGEKEEIIVFAAASMTETLNQVKDVYEKENNVTITYNFDSSGTLKTQIQEGADCDLFISAGQKQMNQLDLSSDKEINKEGLDFVAGDTRLNLLENKVVLVVPEGNPKGIESFDDLAARLAEGSILMAMGNSDVPVGQYTQKILNFYGLDEEALAKSGVITYGSNVKEVTTQVSEGSVDCGIVYCTDAFSAGLTVIDGASKDMCGQVIYPAAVLKTAKNPDAAKAFLDYLTGSEAMAIFEAVGFSPVA
jgi:molybdate transport system substrate-binding protein